MRVPGVEALRETLANLNLDTRGHKTQLKKRLRAATKRAETEGSSQGANKGILDEPRATRPENQLFDSYLVLDFEATCQRHEPKHGSFFGFPNEIIEFPVVLLQWRLKTKKSGTSSSDDCLSLQSVSPTSDTSSNSEESSSSSPRAGDPEVEEAEETEWQLVAVDEFRRFVRPTWRPTLSEFCTDLTGITQYDVDHADTFPEVLNEFANTFMQEHHLFERGNKTVWVTDGPWDLRDFVAKQCYISNIPRPRWLGDRYIDIRASATAYLSRKASEGQKIVIQDDTELLEQPAPSTRALGSANIPTVLEALGLEPFRGRQHSGIDDVRNIARIVQELTRAERGWRVEANALVSNRERRWAWMGKRGHVLWEHPPDLSG